MGIDWWRNDPMLTTSGEELADENRQLRQRIERARGRRGVTDGVGETARYLYAISRDLAPDALAGVGGLMGEPLHVVSHRGLDAVVSDVPLAEFGELALKQNLESLSWLERVARGHDEVVHAAAAAGPVAPMRLATMCLDDDGVRARLDEWHDALHGVLDRVEGRAEWSVKVLVPPPEPAAAAASGSGSGVAYLQQKRAEQQEREHRLARTVQHRGRDPSRPRPHHGRQQAALAPGSAAHTLRRDHGAQWRLPGGRCGR